MIADKVSLALKVSSRLSEAGKSVHVALANIKTFVETNKTKIEIESNARQLTFALGRTLAGALFLEQAAFDLANNIEGAEEDVIVANRWCCAREFTEKIISVNEDIIAQEARIVFGSQAKI